MKKLIIFLALFISLAAIDNKTYGQHINVNININTQPAWGPVGYDYVRYYYIPEINCYYDVNLSLFYFLNRDVWVSARYLPYSYRHYDLYGIYKVVINDYRPWRYHDRYVRQYARYRGYNHRQPVIYASRDARYKRSRSNRVEWVNPRGRSSDNYSDRSRQQNQYRSESNRNRNNNKNNSNNYANRNSNSRLDSNRSNNSSSSRSTQSQQKSDNSRMKKDITPNSRSNNSNFRTVNNSSINKTTSGRSSTNKKTSNSRSYSNNKSNSRK